MAWHPRFVVLANILVCYVQGAELNPWMTPVNVHVRGDSITVDMCETDWGQYKSNPTAAPLGQDITRLSECRATAMALNVPFAVLEEEYEARGCAVGGVLACEPAGMIQHEARVGSTLAANMIAVLPHTLVYSESEVPYQLVGEELSFPAQRYDHVVRVVFAAFARPIAAAAAGVPSPRFPAYSSTFKPDRFYIKLQSSAIGGTSRLRSAFPSVPWLFLHREPVEVLMSLLRGADNPPKQDAPAAEHVKISPKMMSSPCLRSFRKPSHYVRSLINAKTLARDGKSQDPAFGLFGKSVTTPEVHCAAEVARYCDVALEESVKARHEGLRKVLSPSITAALGEGGLDAAASNGTLFVKELHSAGLLATDSKAEAALDALPPLILLDGGIIVNRTLGYGVLGGVGQWIALRYTDTIEHDIMNVYVSHFRSPPLTSEHEAVMHKMAGSYSKARLGTNKYAPKPPGAEKPVVVNGLVEHIPDTERKQSVAWAALREAADVFLRPLYESLQEFAVPLRNSTRLRLE